MHIIIGAITALAGLIWALNSLQRSGFDLNSLNPFHWARRRKWQKLYCRKPLYELDKPLEAAGAIIVGLVNQEGIISQEQKKHVIELFESNFNLNSNEANELLLASSHLVKDELNLAGSVRNILEISRSKFTPEMIETFIEILKSAANFHGSATAIQQDIIDAVTKFFRADAKSNEWGK